MTANSIPMMPPSPSGDALVTPPPVSMPTSGGSLSDGHGVDVVVPVVVTDGAAVALGTTDTVVIAAADREPDLVTDAVPLGVACADADESGDTLGALDAKTADDDGDAVDDDDARPVCDAADADADCEASADAELAAVREIPVAAGDSVAGDCVVETERECSGDALVDALTAADRECDTDALTERVHAGDRDCDADTLGDREMMGERDGDAETLSDRVRTTVAVVDRVRDGVALLDIDCVWDEELVDDGVAEDVADEDRLSATPTLQLERRDRRASTRSISRQRLK